MSSETTNQVLIIGAGLGGLSLAQGLRHANPPVPFRIFERDHSSAFRAQGYRIRISPDGAAALQKVLPEHLWRAFEATCSPVAEGLGSRVDAASAEVRDGERPGRSDDANRRLAPEFMAGKSYNADRTVLRNILLSGLEDDIVFDKKFAEYGVNSDGTVTAVFADGSSETGTVLIGADGTRSAVRRQLLPGLPLLDSEGRAVFGKTPMTSDVLPLLMKGMCLVGQGPEAGVKMLCDPMRFTDGGLDAELRSRFHVPDDYLYWVIVFREDFDPREDKTTHLSAEASRQLSLDLTSSWHDTIRALLTNQEPDATSALTLYTSSATAFTAEWESLEHPDTPNQLPKGPVTLLGDAAHPMTPVGGVGANTAFQEAADACKAMSKVFGGSWGLTDALMAYQGLMGKRGRDVIQRSHVGGGHFFGMRGVEELKVVE